MRHACSERTIHKELQGMIKDGYLFKRRAVGKATMEYRLNIKKLGKALEALPEKQPCNSATYHLANLQDQSSNSARSTLQNSKINLANLQPRITIEETLEVPENKEREDVSANASTSHASFDLSENNACEEDMAQAEKVIAPVLTLPSKQTSSPAREAVSRSRRGYKRSPNAGARKSQQKRYRKRSYAFWMIGTACKRNQSHVHHASLRQREPWFRAILPMRSCATVATGYRQQIALESPGIAYMVLDCGILLRRSGNGTLWRA